MQNVACTAEISTKVTGGYFFRFTLYFFLPSPKTTEQPLLEVGPGQGSICQISRAGVGTWALSWNAEAIEGSGSGEWGMGRDIQK